MNALQGIRPATPFPAAMRGAAPRVAVRRPPAAEPPAAESMPVSKPLGESGAQVRSVNRHNSFLRMFMMEASHLPAQLRRAGGLHQVIGRDVRIKVEILPGGSPVAVAGAASTAHRAADGRIGLLEELAYVSFLRRFITGSAALASGAGTQTAPPVVRTTDSLLSAIQVIGDRRRLGRMTGEGIAGFLRSVSPAALEPAIGALARMGSALERLRTAFAALADRGTFTEVRAESSSPLFLAARAANGAPPGEYRVEVLRTARGHSIESDAVPGALGLTGSFRVNGTRVEVTGGDSLLDLAAAVNRGEDLNGDGVLEAGEDLDGNGRLDGGTAAHGVRAGFLGGRLTLTVLDARAGEIQVEDPDGILAAVGLLETDGFGQTFFPNQLRAPRTALIRVDGRELESGTDVFESAIPGVELEVLGVPGREIVVTVEADTSGTVAAVRSAVEEFNSAIREVNRPLLNAGGLLAEDPAATRVRAELLRAVLSPVELQPPDLDESREVGLERAERRRTGLAEEQLAAVGRTGRGPLAGLVGAATAFNALFQLGIVAEEDDTLRLDEERFAARLAESPAEVAGLFARAAGEAPRAAGRAGGIAVRVLERLGTALGESGLLELRSRTLAALSRLRLGENYAEAFMEAHRGALLAGLLPAAQR